MFIYKFTEQRKKRISTILWEGFVKFSNPHNLFRVSWGGNNCVCFICSVISFRYENMDRYSGASFFFTWKTFPRIHVHRFCHSSISIIIPCCPDLTGEEHKHVHDSFLCFFCYMYFNFRFQFNLTSSLSSYKWTTWSFHFHPQASRRPFIGDSIAPNHWSSNQILYQTN